MSGAQMSAMSEWRLFLADEAALLRAAARLSEELRAGDLVTLNGPMGAGKSTFARGMIRHLLGDGKAEVPSPTYTLLQTYDAPRFSIVHADLFRIADPSELAELGWEDAAENALVLVEWAERAGEILAEDRLDIHLAIAGPEGGAREMVLHGHGAFAGRLARARNIQTLLDRAGFGEARRDFMLGDASVRAYERVLDLTTGRRAVLMIAPRRPDGPPIRMGKSYSTLVHLAESVEEFVAIAKGLRALGASAPDIYAGDLGAGLLLIEDLGSEGVIDAAGPIEARYRASVEWLANLHGRVLPPDLPIEAGRVHRLKRYDLEALTIETELLLDWFYPYELKRSPNAAARLSFIDSWVATLEPVISGEKTWVMRDFHSPNLIWLPEREGIARVGVIDFQDAVIGHPAYDLVSLLQDARVDVPEALELALLGHYARQRRAREPDFDLAAFTAAYAILGAQRATKILGIFVRLDRRDGKPAYLKHLPRIEAYLRRCLQHPALARLRTWYETHLPRFAPPARTDDAHEHDQKSDGAGGGAGNPHAAADGSGAQTLSDGGGADAARS